MKTDHKPKTPPRFYCPIAIETGEQLTLPANVGHHATRVLRLESGSEIVLFNGSGGEYLATIAAIDRNTVRAEIAEHREIERESGLRIHLVQGLSTGDKMDFTLQKAVELGVSHIQPVEMQRSVVRLNAERAVKRAAHWQQIVVSACEQCGRNYIPQVAAVSSFVDWLPAVTEATQVNLKLLLSPRAAISLKKAPMTGDSAIILLVGPEGGLTAEEEQMAHDAGFISVKLGSRILRTETAALAAVSAMQTLWGDFV